MITSAWNARAYRSDSELERIADFLSTGVEQLHSEFSALAMDTHRDLRLWEDAQGRLGAVSMLRAGSQGPGVDPFLPYLFVRMHPDIHDADLRSAIVAWGIERAREVARERGRAHRLTVGAGSEHGDYRRWLESQGFVPAGFQYLLARSLHKPIPEPQLPEGFALRELSEIDLEVWVELINDVTSFPWTIEQQREVMAASDYRPDFHLMAVAADGTPAALCICHIVEEWNRRSGRNEGWISELGVRSQFHQPGLERAMLLIALRRLKHAGVDTTMRQVYTADPDADLGFYTSLAFEQRNRTIFYQKELFSEMEPAAYQTG